MENGQAKEMTVEDGREAKRFKSHGALKLKDFALPEVLDSLSSIREAYKQAKPYPHAAIPKVFQTDFFNKVVSEIQHNSKVNFKESDLFRVYQSMDLANLNEQEHAKAMPNVWKLREILYSAEWRSLIENICGLPEGTLIDSKFSCLQEKWSLPFITHPLMCLSI